VWRLAEQRSRADRAPQSEIAVDAVAKREAGFRTSGGTARPPRGLREFTMKELVGMIVEALVDQPDAVNVSEVKGNHAHVIELNVAKEDLGKVIGKGGAHASAIRTILAAASGKENKRYILEIIEH
jgi:uncharacterized protein